MPESRVPAGVPTGGRFATSAREESGVALAQESTDDGFSTTWPRIMRAENRTGTVRTTNGGEISGILSTHGWTFSIDVETPDGRTVGIGGWRVRDVRLDDVAPDPEPATPQIEDAPRLSPTDQFIVDHARRVEAAFRSDAIRTAAEYRSEAGFRDPDYIGSANLSYLASQAAEATGDRDAQIEIEEADEVLEDDPGNRAARDTCARIVRTYAATLTAATQPAPAPRT